MAGAAGTALPFPSPPILLDGEARPDGIGRRFVQTAGGRRLAYAEAGAGRPVVLIHGTLMTADDMRLGPMPALARSSRCVAFDRPGHG